MKLQNEKISWGIDSFLCHVPERTDSTDNTTNALGHFCSFLVCQRFYSILSVIYMHISFVLNYNLEF